MEKALINNASGFQSVRYLRYYWKVPVYGALVTVNVGKSQGNVFSFYNDFDYDILKDFSVEPKLTKENAHAVVEKRLSEVFKKVNTKEAELFVYRHKILPRDIEGQKPPPLTYRIAGKQEPTKNQRLGMSRKIFIL